MRRILSSLASFALVSSPALASNNRAVVESAASAIEQHYFDSKVAATIAAGLRKQDATGEFDNLEPTALASTLTQLLAPYDHHFAVQWSPSNSRSGGDRAGYDTEVQFRRSGYGIASVERLPGNLALIRLTNFAPIDFSQDSWPARLAMDAAIAVTRGADATIIDLRENHGGDPGGVGYLLSGFLPRDVDAYTRFKAAGGMVSIAPPKLLGPSPITTPLYILTSSNTGSAAEGFAYALQAAHRATVVGERTAGGANPGDFTEIGDGFKIYISFAQSMNPLTHTNWEGTGVIPDVPVRPSDALREAERLALATSSNTIEQSERIDARRVLETLNARPGISNTELTRIQGTYGDLTVTASGGMLVGRRPDGTTRIFARVAEGVFSPFDAANERWTFVGQPAAKTIRVDHVDGTVSEIPRMN